MTQPAWEEVKLHISDEWDSAATIARRAGVSINRSIVGLTFAVNTRLIEYRERRKSTSCVPGREYRRLGKDVIVDRDLKKDPCSTESTERGSENAHYHRLNRGKFNA